VAFSPAVPLVPDEPPRSPPQQRPRGVIAPVSATERFRTPGRFGDLTASRLTGILWTLDRGYLEDWADLVEYAICSDPDLQSLYTTAITRITQATWQVVPNKYVDTRYPQDAQVAAEFCDEMIGRMREWRKAQTTLLHALALGFQPMEKEWETDRVARKNLVRQLHFRHGHRFRLDTQYKYRLYDHGDQRRTSGSLYGQPLDPNRWIVHKHQETAGYPTVAGLMRAGIWPWMFIRWADKDYTRALEKHGAPYVYGELTENTPQDVRDKMITFLEDLHSNKAAVVEAGSKIVFEAAAQISGTPMHEVYLQRAQGRIDKLWLGTTDITGPGDSGSNAAVNTRAGAVTDPRMVAHGIELGESVSDQLFRQALELNRHLFGGRMPPVPTYEAKTATDEVQTDKQDLLEQGGATAGALVRGVADDELGTGTPDPLKPDGASDTPVVDAVAGAAGAEKAADTALNGAQVASMLEIIQAVVDDRLPRQSAVEIMKRAFNLDSVAADALLGTVGKGFVPDSSNTPPDPEGVPMTASDPKALTETGSGSSTKRKPRKRPVTTSSSVQMTLPISSHSMSRIAAVLRGELDDPEL
jgi:phage gp29-like protein